MSHKQSRRLTLLTDAQRRQLVDEWGRAHRDVTGISLSKMIDEQASIRPDSIAAVCEDGHLTYGTADAAASLLADTRVTKGVTAERIVGVCVDRSLDAFIALCAVWKSGAAYLPLDPSYPAQRISSILADAQPIALITCPRSMLVAPDGCRSIVITREKMTLSVSSACDRTDLASSAWHISQTAYVMYTSGSTGAPKGVSVTHAGINSLAVTQRDRLNVNSQSRVLQFAGSSFDASIWEVLMSVSSGATLIYIAGTELSG